MKVKCQLLSVKCQNGQMLIIAIIFLAVVLILSASLFGRVASFLRFGSNNTLREQATNLAEAGVERTLWQLNQTAGVCSDCQDERNIGSTGTFKVTITNKTSSLKTITATGYIPNSTSPKAKRTIKVDTLISAATISFRYAVQVGAGGVDMENSSTINGTVYSNGNITGSGSSVINGEAWAVGTISSPDPTITNLPPHPGASPQPLPTVDYQYWKDQATAGGTTTCTGDPGGNTCKFVGGFQNLGPQKYVGNLDLTNLAQATMNGPIYVTGDIDVQNSASLKLNDSFGSNGTVLITDGKITVQNSGQLIPTNANPKGYILAVTTSVDPQLAVNIKNNGVNAIFYTLDGGATLQNSAQVTALVAKQLKIKNSASLTYDEGLASGQFSAGPGGSWQIKKGTYRFTSSP